MSDKIQTNEQNAAQMLELFKCANAAKRQMRRERDAARTLEMKQEFERAYAQAEADLKTVLDALREIRDKHGKVCSIYEVCEHASCNSSYAAWAIADKTLAAIAKNKDGVK